MKYINLIMMVTISTLCLSRNGFAQKPTLQMGLHIPPDEAKSGKNKNSVIIAGNEDELLVSDRAKGGSVITSYNSTTLKKKETFKLDYPEIGNKEADWVKRLFHKNQITTVYGFYDKKADEFRVYGKISDRKNKVIKKEQVLMSSNAKKRKEIGQLVTKYSNDNSKLLIFREPSGKQFQNEKMEFVLYDNELNKLSEKSLSFPYPNKAISIQEVLVTNEGHISVIAYWEPTKDEIKENPSLKGQSTFKIFGVSEDNEKLDEIELNSKNYDLSTCYGIVYNDSTQSILYTGFYREAKAGSKKYSSGVNGIYYLKLDTRNWELAIQKFNPVDEKTITKFLMGSQTSEKAQKRAKKTAEKGFGFSHMILKNIFYDQDGSVRIISQVEYMTESCTQSSTGQRRCTRYYHNNQILQFTLNGEGDLQYSVVIPKAQTIMSPQVGIGNGFVSVSTYANSSKEAYVGHVQLSSKDKMYYIYNDADQNFNAKKVAKHGNNNFRYMFTANKKSRLCYVTVDSKGKISKQPLVDSRKQNIMIIPDNARKLGLSSVVVFAKVMKSKELILLRISLDGKPNKKGK